MSPSNTTDSDLARIAGRLTGNPTEPVWQPPTYQRLSLAHIERGSGFVVLVHEQRGARWWCGPHLENSVDWIVGIDAYGWVHTAPLARYATASDAVAAFGDHTFRRRVLSGHTPRFEVVGLAVVQMAVVNRLRRRRSTCQRRTAV